MQESEKRNVQRISKDNSFLRHNNELYQQPIFFSHKILFALQFTPLATGGSLLAAVKEANISALVLI